MASRYLQFRLDGEIVRTPSGGIRVPARLARVGMQTYHKDGKPVVEYRPEGEVFRDDTLDSFRGATVTNLHPSRFVDAKNYKLLACGHVGDDVRRDGDFVAATLHIHDASLIDEVCSGKKREISAGYDVDIEETPGEIDGTRYDRIQRNIRANHVAILPPGCGRAGPEVAIRLDSCDNEENGETMKINVRIDGKDVELTPEDAQSRIDALVEKLDADKALLVTERDALQGRLDETQRILAERDASIIELSSAQRIDALVAERIGVIERARRVMRTDSAFDGKNNSEIKRLAIGERSNGKSDDWVDGAFDTLHDACCAQANDSLRSIARHDAADDPMVRLQKQIEERNANAWKVRDNQ